MKIVQLKSADARICSEINSLLRQLSSSAQTGKCSPKLLKRIVESEESELWVALDKRRTVGMATLAIIVKPGGMVARVEDVVVDASARGQGLGAAITKKLIERAKAHKAKLVLLSSRPSRVAANALYKKLGFKLHKTNTYQMKL